MIRVVAALAVVVLLLTPAPGRAQPRGKIPRVGVLLALSIETRAAAFREGLRELGYEEGRTIVIDQRTGPLERVDALAAELVRARVDVIFADSAPATRAAQRATSTIPIVFGATADPVGAGFVQSLAHPGGNITGFSEITPELIGKRAQLLKEILPSLATLAVLGNPDHAFHRSMVDAANAAARRLGMRTAVFEVRRAAEMEPAFAAMQRDRADAVLLLPHPLFGNERRRLAALAIQHRLPLAVTSPEGADAGGLFAYATDYVEQFRRAAVYVDRILKGARPAELPVELPTKFELLVNARTAKALGLDLAPSFVQRADRVIR